MKSRVAVMPCTGVGQVVGTISRQTAYIVCEDMCPDKTNLVCLPALAKGVGEDVEMVTENAVVVIEGCNERCASNVLSRHGIRPRAEVFIPDVLRDTGIRVRRETRRNLTENEEEVAKNAALRVAEIVASLLNGERS